MKSLHTLLKVAQRRMDELGVEAAKIQQEIDALGMKRLGLLAAEQNEIALAGTNSMFASMLAAYRMRVKQQIADVQGQVGAHEQLLSDIRVRLQEAYVEKSKFEQLIEQQATRAAAERAAIEQAQLDEVAINRAGSNGK